MSQPVIHTVKLTREKTTPGTVVFKEVSTPGEAPKVKTLYIQNYVLGMDTAQAIEVTIKVAA